MEVLEEKKVIQEIKDTKLNGDGEKTFLQGPQSRWREFSFIVRVMFEFIKGFRALHFVGPCVTVFGSARFSEEHAGQVVWNVGVRAIRRRRRTLPWRR